MKKRIALFLTLILLLCTGCGAKQEELIVFAAASLTETLTQLGDDYMQTHPEVSIVFNFESSGTLRTQIEEGAPCDLFLSAGQKQMDGLNAAPVDLLENKVVLAVPDGNPAGISSFADLKNGLEAGKLLLAMGNADVPVGQYAREILDWYGLDETALDGVTYGSNVKEVAMQVTEAAVDCGILYATDAAAAGLTVVDTATEDMCGRVIYPAAVLGGSDEARAFLEYLQSDAAAAVFSAAGFTS